jgi:hypothetical protein
MYALMMTPSGARSSPIWLDVIICPFDTCTCIYAFGLHVVTFTRHVISRIELYDPVGLVSALAMLLFVTAIAVLSVSLNLGGLCG